MLRTPLVTIVVVLLGVHALAAAQPESKPPSTGINAERSTLVVISFNIRYGTAKDGENAWSTRKQLVIDRIRDSKADIVGMQEALKFQLDELLAAMPEYRSTGVGRDDGKEKGEHAAILYRHDRLSLQTPFLKALDSDTHGTFWLSDTPSKPGSTSWGNRITRICSWARLRDARADRSFVFFNTHFDHESQRSRERSAALLKERVSLLAGPVPVIITGDFNAGEGNPAIAAMLRDNKSDAASGSCPPLRDSFRVLHPDERAVGTFNNFKPAPPFTGDKIDYIFIDDHWQVVEASIDRTMPDGHCPSDHFPVLARLRLKPAPSPQVPAEPPAHKP